jgi:predicted 3-demethylubiquinone-9 3-methyltransferase (glyoxalase superfamily)
MAQGPIGHSLTPRKNGDAMQFNEKIVPCLWFASEAEEAARYYVGIFPNSRIGHIAYYGEAGKENHQQKPGTVLTVEFQLGGQTFTALNGGPVFKFSEAVSFQIFVDDQKELDYYWDKLTTGGDPKAQVCGWLKDKYGLSWQVVPREMVHWWGVPNEKSERAMAAMMKMKKLDIAELKKAYEGR